MILRHSEQSRGCNAADEVHEARLSIPQLYQRISRGILRLRFASLRMTAMNKAVGIIPARWSSTRFPGKPLHPIAGKALLRRVWERCERAKNLDSVIVATDDMRIAEAAFNWGAEVALTSTSHCSGTDRIAEVARNAKQFAFIVNIQGDEPLVDPRLIDKIVEKLRSDRAIEIVTAAHRFEHPEDALSPHQVKVVVDLAGNALYFSRAPIPFQEEGHRSSCPFVIRASTVFAGTPSCNS